MTPGYCGMGEIVDKDNASSVFGAGVQDTGQPSVAWPDPTPEMLCDPTFNAIWNVIKSWDISVPAAYGGYCGATGNHARAILDAITAPQTVLGTPSERQNTEESKEAAMPEITLEDEIEAVRAMAGYIGARDGQGAALATALRSALARLEASRVAKDETPSQEIARLQREIGERQWRLQYLMLGDPRKSVTLQSQTFAPPTTTSEGENIYRKVVDSDAGRALRESMKKD